MSRTILFAAFLLAATAVQAASPARESANGGGGTCPEAEPQAVASEAPAAASEPAPQGNAAPAAPTPSAAKSSATARPRNGVRWHSFVPGMFK